jgi:hypothetical protein
MRDGEEGPTGRGPAPQKAPRRNLGSDGDLGSVMQFGVAIVLFTLVGNWLDGKYGTSPALLLVGMGVGTAAGFYSMYRKLTARERQAKEDRRLNAPGNGSGKSSKSGKGGVV